MKTKLEQAQEEYQGFIQKKKSIILSTVSQDGSPNASYAPFVIDDDKNIYIYISGLSKHTGNLESTGKASVMFIDDESETKQIFARKRLTYDCKAEKISKEGSGFEAVSALFTESFGEMISNFNKMPDFRVIKLSPQSGLFVIGFGAAFQIQGKDLNTLIHMTGGGGHGHGHAHGAHAHEHAKGGKKPEHHSKGGSLKERYEHLKSNASGRLFPRDAAVQLGVSEAELLATGIGGNIVPLQFDIKGIFKGIEEIGHSMSLTRNDEAVSEIKALMPNVKWPHGEVGITVGAIDLRIFSKKWKYAFAQIGERKGLQFFDAHGDAIYKLYLTDQSQVDAFEKLIKSYRIEEDTFQLDIEQKSEATHYATTLGDNTIKIFREQWDKLTDVHDFLKMIQEFGLSRLEALKIAGESRAEVLDRSILQDTFEKISEKEIPVMLFVSNEGMIQIYDDVLKNIKMMHGWLNVLDPNFNLHLKSEEVDSVWHVRRPSKQGQVSSLELFNKKGELILQIFHSSKGAEKYKQENSLEVWKDLLQSYCKVLA